MGKHRDWTDIRKDYEESGLSYAKLAEKYGVPIDTLKKAAGRQKWVKRAPTAREKAAARKRKIANVETALAEMAPPETAPSEMAPQNGTAEPEGKIIPLYPHKILPAESSQERYTRMVMEMLDRVEEAMGRMNTEDIGSVKLMTGAMKDLRDILHLNKSELDLQEQRARIAKLQSETRTVEEDGGAYGVIVLPAVQEVTPPE